MALHCSFALLKQVGTTILLLQVQQHFAQEPLHFLDIGTVGESGNYTVAWSFTSPLPDGLRFYLLLFFAAAIILTVMIAGADALWSFLSRAATALGYESLPFFFVEELTVLDDLCRG